MHKRYVVAALAGLLAAGVFLPAAQAAHYTWYHTLGDNNTLDSVGQFHKSMADFEPGNNNFNGPANDPSTWGRAVPTDDVIPVQFSGKSDILSRSITTAGCADCTTAVFDSQLVGHSAQSGAIVPYTWYAAEANTLANGRAATSMSFATWWGWWNDADSDGVIDDRWCADTNLFCPPHPTEGWADEFVWYGANVGVNTEAVLYMFPYDMYVSFGNPSEPASLAGDCNKYTDDGNGVCSNPAPDVEYRDSTNSAGNPDNQRWAAGLGGGSYLTDSLVANLHAVSLAGAARTTTPEQFAIGCSNCWRDYDFFQGLGGDGVSDLYLDTLRPVRNAAWTAPILAGISADFVFCYGLDTCTLPTPDVCPTEDFTGSTVVRQCSVDTTHLDAIKGADSANNPSTYKAIVTIDIFATVPAISHTPSGSMQHAYCNAATGSNCPTAVPAQGFYGDLSGYSLEPQTKMQPGGFIRADIFGIVWKDDNSDGYIGEPDPTEVGLYNAGIDNSPNSYCTGGNCEHAEIVPIPNQIKAWSVTLAPRAGGSGWPPGSLFFQNTEDYSAAKPLNPGSSYDWATPMPLFGFTPAVLAVDDECGATAMGCRALDTVFIPSGSTVTTLDASIGTVSVTWTEGATSYSATFTPTDSSPSAV